ncbi:hypothetical protein [Aurantivibrio plasticivorans]
MKYGSVVTLVTPEQEDASLASLKQIRHQMEEAVNQLDWQLVLRMDRLCAQLTAALDGKELSNMREFVAELLRIKKLYAQAIRYLNKEILSVPNQAF